MGVVISYQLMNLTDRLTLMSRKGLEWNVLQTYLVDV